MRHNKNKQRSKSLCSIQLVLVLMVDLLFGVCSIHCFHSVSLTALKGPQTTGYKLIDMHWISPLKLSAFYRTHVEYTLSVFSGTFNVQASLEENLT